MFLKLAARSGWIVLMTLAMNLTRGSTAAAGSLPYETVPTDYLQRILSNDGWSGTELALGLHLAKHPGAMCWSPDKSFTAVFGFALDPWDPGTVERNTVYVWETTSSLGLGGGYCLAGPLIQLGYWQPDWLPFDPLYPDEFTPLGDFVQLSYCSIGARGERDTVVTMSKNPLSDFNIPAGSPAPNAILFVSYGHSQVTAALFGPDNILVLPEPSGFVHVALCLTTLALFGRRWFPSGPFRINHGWSNRPQSKSGT
ncbi:MAG: hypothetical protein ACK6D3_05455 [Planctomycetaceae bacterium]|jgi:hypothetical protein